MSQFSDHNRVTGSDDTTVSHIPACDWKGAGSVHHELPFICYVLCCKLSCALEKKIKKKTKTKQNQKTPPKRNPNQTASVWVI